MAYCRMKEKEFANLIRAHSRIINKVSYFYASGWLPFADLRQEICINIWLGLDGFRGESKMSTWIYRVAVNTALMAIRTSRHKTVATDGDLEICKDCVEMSVACQEDLQALRGLIDGLEDMEKAVILLWLDEYTYEAIADTLGLKRNTVATKLHRIKEKLKKDFFV